MTEPLVFSDSADEEWARILDTDQPLAQVLNDVFDRIEDGTQHYTQYDNHARSTTVNVPGRDQQYFLVWQPGTNRHELLIIGRL